MDFPSVPEVSMFVSEKSALVEKPPLNMTVTVETSNYEVNLIRVTK